MVLSRYTASQPTPMLTVSAGVETVAWSYTLRDFNLRRRTSVCSPSLSNPSAFRCQPHGGGNLWVEAWPARIFLVEGGFDVGVRAAGTVYRPARDRHGNELTQPSLTAGILGEGHLAVKTRMVLTVGPWQGPALGARVRLAYARAHVQEQTPFVAVPGFHAAQVGLGLEGYVPLLWKHLSFDVRGELIPLVYYQETSGFPVSVVDAIKPSSTANNPGFSARTLGYRFDAGVRLTLVLGGFVELRAFSEGFGTWYAGFGKRTDSSGTKPITDGRTTNVTVGATVAVGWLFPQFLDLPQPLESKVRGAFGGS
jgi:hypothetical protein